MNIEKEKAKLLKESKETLADRILNEKLNDVVARYADYEEEEDTTGHGKRVPYIGWFWRNVDFVNGYITVADCGEFIGFCENNKWGYAERRLTEEEATQVVAIVCEAYARAGEGGVYSEIIANTKAKLDELWPLLQTFSIKVEGWWVHGPQGKNLAFLETEQDADVTIVRMQEAAPGFRYWKERA